MTYPPAGYPPPDPFQGMPTPSPDPFGAGGWQPPTMQSGYGYGTPPPQPPQPPHRNKTWLVITIVTVVVVAAVGAGALMWHLFSRDAGGGTGGPPSAAAALPESVPPLGALRPPRDQLMSSLEQQPGQPRWTHQRKGSTNILGGDAYTLVLTADDYGTDKGILAMDAGTGEPRWSKPVLPAGMESRMLNNMFSKCVIDRAATTIGCAFGDGVSSSNDIVLAFFDTATGSTKNSTTVPSTYWGEIRGLYNAGDGFVVVLDDAVVGYGADGREAWRIPNAQADPKATGHPNVAVYGDQGIVMFLDGRVLDATTGSVIVQGAGALGTAAFASGFGMSDGETFDFYDFSGTKTASVPAEGFTFVDGYGTNGYRWLVGMSQQQPGSSGLYYPLAYNEASGDLRAFDPASGHVLWTHRVGQDGTRSVAAYGNGTTCFIFVRDDSTVHVKVQTCETDSDNPLLAVPTQVSAGTYFSFLGSDGQRMLFGTETDEHNEVVAIDGTSGHELWRKTEPNLALSLWADKGLYSTYSDVFRWF